MILHFYCTRIHHLAKTVASNCYVVSSFLTLSCFMGEVIFSYICFSFNFANMQPNQRELQHALMFKGKIHIDALWKKPVRFTLGKNPMSMHSKTEYFHKLDFVTKENYKNFC